MGEGETVKKWAKAGVAGSSWMLRVHLEGEAVESRRGEERDREFWGKEEACYKGVLP